MTGQSRGQELDLAFDERLLGELDEDGAALDEFDVEFGLAGAVATDGVDVQPGHTGGGAGAGHHLVGEDRRVALVGGAGGDDLGAGDGMFGVVAQRHVEAESGRVALELGHRRGVDVEHAERVDAEVGAEGESLELGLGARSDHRHGGGSGGSERLGRHRRRGCGAERGQQRHLRQHDRVAGVDVGECAERGHRLQAPGRVDRVSVDELEAVGGSVARRHQFDHAVDRVARDARRLVEERPAAELAFHLGGQVAKQRFESGVGGPSAEVVDVDESNHGGAPVRVGGDSDGMAERCGPAIARSWKL